MAYRTTRQEDCMHETKLKMAGFKDRYECVKCQKIIPLAPSQKPSEGKSEDNIEYLNEKYDKD